MIKSLVVLFVGLQLADLVIYLMEPQLEANPAMMVLPVWGVTIAKLAGITLALAVVARISSVNLQATALGCGIAIGAFCVGANMAILSMRV